MSLVRLRLLLAVGLTLVVLSVFTVRGQEYHSTFGFYRVNSVTTGVQNSLYAGANIGPGLTGAIVWDATNTRIKSPTDGVITVTNLAQTTGSMLKVDALPTIASGFGTSPSITAGSTPLAGSVNVGSGTPGTGGVINFNGTAFPSVPFVLCQDITSLMLVRCTATTTQLTVAATAFTAGNVVVWQAISSK